jgi:putative transcriptional regulator
MSLYRVYIPPEIDVKAIRGRLGLTQQQFAARFGFNITTLRHWEQGRRVPEGPTRAYLMVIDREPKAVEKALRIA